MFKFGMLILLPFLNNIVQPISIKVFIVLSKGGILLITSKCHPRHWDKYAEITKHSFNFVNRFFVYLSNLIERIFSEEVLS